MSLSILSLLQNFGLDFSLGLHDQLQHLIVRVSVEHYLASVELVEGDPCTPDVDSLIEVTAEHDLRSPVKSTHHILGYLHFISLKAASEVAKLNFLGIFVHHDIIRFHYKKELLAEKEFD